MHPTLPITPTGLSGPIETSYDVVIVGARAAGASLAMLLARRGISVLALDRSARGSDTLSTHSLTKSAVLLLSRWGVLDEIRAADTPVTTNLTFRYGGEPLRLNVSGHGDVDGLYSPRRTVLDATLVEQAERSGAAIRHGARVRGVTTDPTGRVDGVQIDHEGQLLRVSARWVIGADGTGSRVATQVEAPVLRQEESTSAVIYSFWRGLDPHRIENHFEEAGTAFGVIPTNDGEANVWVAMDPERFKAEARGDLGGAFDRAVAASPSMTETLRGCRQVGGLRAFPGLPGYLRKAHGPGWALVGDAGYFKDPLSAHGITDAFIGAELLAAAIDRVVNDGQGEQESLAQFQQLRDQVAEPMMAPIAQLATMKLDGKGAAAAFVGMNAALQQEWAFLHTDAVNSHDRLVEAAASRLRSAASARPESPSHPRPSTTARFVSLPLANRWGFESVCRSFDMTDLVGTETGTSDYIVAFTGSPVDGWLALIAIAGSALVGTGKACSVAIEASAQFTRGSQAPPTSHDPSRWAGASAARSSTDASVKPGNRPAPPFAACKHCAIAVPKE